MLPVWVYWIPAVATACLIFFISHQPKIEGLPDTIPDWFAHAVEYGFFTVALVYGTTRGFRADLRTAPRVFAAVAIASFYGITDEFHQSFVGRDATVIDWVADTVGALIMAGAVLWVFDRMADRQPRV